MRLTTPETPSADFVEDNKLSSVVLDTGAPSVPDNTMQEEETFSAPELVTGAVDATSHTVCRKKRPFYWRHYTGAVIIPFGPFTENNVLSTGNISTGVPVVDKVLKVGDHLFYMEELISRPPELGEAILQR